MRARVQATAPRSPLASFTATIRGCSASADEGLDLDRDERARRDVVEHHRQVGGVGDRGEVPEQAGLRRPVVVRRDDEQAVHAEPLGRPRLLDRVRGVVGADAGDDGRAVADGVHHRLEDGVLLAVADGRRLPRRAEDDQAVVRLPVDQVRGQLLRAGEVDRAVLGERGDHRREHAPERPGGVGGHGENLPSGPRCRLPRRTPTPRTAAPTTTRTSPRPASARRGATRRRRPGAQVSPSTRSVDVGDHQPVGVRQERGVHRSAADHPERTRARRAPAPPTPPGSRPVGRPAGVRRQDDVGPAGQGAEPLGQRLPGAPAHDDRGARW